MSDTSELRNITTRGYILGYSLSLVTTLAAYFLVLRHINTHHSAYSHNFLVAAIITLALGQLLVQLIFFLHIGKEAKPRWNLMVLLSAATVVIILVFGSLWIMYNLNYHMEAPGKLDKQIINDEGVRH